MLLTHVDLIEKLYVSSRLPAVCLLTSASLNYNTAERAAPDL